MKKFLSKLLDFATKTAGGVLMFAAVCEWLDRRNG